MRSGGRAEKMAPQLEGAEIIGEHMKPDPGAFQRVGDISGWRRRIKSRHSVEISIDFPVLRQGDNPA